MSSKQNFIKTTQRDGVTPQTLYIDAGSAGTMAEVLKDKGTKRVLILSNKATLDYRPVEAMIKKYNDSGIRTFIYQRRNIVADSRDIEGALDTYKEYDCGMCDKPRQARIFCRNRQHKVRYQAPRLCRCRQYADFCNSRVHFL